jgi:hypothetical protein
MNGTETRQPTKPQFDLIRTLLMEIGELSEDVANTWRAELNLARTRQQFDFDAASAAIEDLIRAKKDLRRKANAGKAKVQLPDVPEGRYAVEVDGELKFYHVEVSDKGFVTAFVRASDELHELRFKAMVAILERIVAAGIDEAAFKFAIEIGECRRCHRTLTSKWRHVGIGPECSKK